MNVAVDNTARLKKLIRQSLEQGDASDCGRCEVLKDRTKDRGMLLRVRDDDGGSVIVKAWLARNLKEKLKGLVGVSMARREWRAHRHLERAGVAVPRLLGIFGVRCTDGRRYDVVVVEDLGATRNGLVFMKDLIASSDEARIRQFEDEVIALTGALLNAGIVDVDHQLRNVVLNGTDQPKRIDFECAQVFRGAEPPAQALGTMLGRLIVSHAFGTQPDLARTEAFAERLASSIAASSEVKNVAQKHIDRALTRQRESAGVDSQLRLAW